MERTRQFVGSVNVKLYFLDGIHFTFRLRVIYCNKRILFYFNFEITGFGAITFYVGNT